MTTFTEELQRLIDRSYDNTWNEFQRVKSGLALYKVPKRTTDRWKSPGEPAFVQQLAAYPFVRRQLASLIQDHLSPAISKGKPLVSGVFIHQKPKVKFGRPASQIELGDLLFVRHHFQTGSNSPQGRAFLLQAKSTSHPATGSLTGKEAKQFDLYSNWDTDFTFPHGEFGAPPSGTKWNFKNGPAPYTETGFYGLVSNDRAYVANKFPGRSSWAIGAAFAPAAGRPKQVSASTSLAQTMDSFLRGSHGRPWHVGASADDHWSHFVEDILKASMDFESWKTRVSRIGQIDIPRHHEALAYVRGFSLHNSARDIMRALEMMGDQFQFSEESFHEASDFIGTQAQEWVESISGGGEDFPPSEQPIQRERPAGGMSVVYVATFGNEALAPPRRD